MRMRSTYKSLDSLFASHLQEHRILGDISRFSLAIDVGSARRTATIPDPGCYHTDNSNTEWGSFAKFLVGVIRWVKKWQKFVAFFKIPGPC